MKSIPLTQGLSSQVDDKWYNYLMQWKWYAQKDDYTYYAERRQYINGKYVLFKMHRVILNITDSQIKIDHWNRNGLDNQESNLRISTNSQNQMNRKPTENCSSIYKGVGWNKASKMWRSIITYNSKSILLGYFEKEVAAAIIYNQKAIELFKEFARLNVISDNALLTINEDDLIVFNRNRSRQKLIKKISPSGYFGVYQRGSKWRSKIVKDKISYGLGTFNTKIEAVKAYNKKAFELYGKHAKLNIIYENCGS